MKPIWGQLPSDIPTISSRYTNKPPNRPASSSTFQSTSTQKTGLKKKEDISKPCPTLTHILPNSDYIALTIEFWGVKGSLGCRLALIGMFVRSPPIWDWRLATVTTCRTCPLSLLSNYLLWRLPSFIQVQTMKQTPSVDNGYAKKNPLPYFSKVFVDRRCGRGLPCTWRYLTENSALDNYLLT